MRFSEKERTEKGRKSSVLLPASGSIGIGMNAAPKPTGFDIAIASPDMDVDAWMKIFSSADTGARYAASKEEVLAALKGEFVSQLSSVTLQTNTLRYDVEVVSKIDSTLRHIVRILHLRLQSDAASGQIQLKRTNRQNKQ